MQNFSNQCFDIASSIMAESGDVKLHPGAEAPYALSELYRALGEDNFEGESLSEQAAATLKTHLETGRPLRPPALLALLNFNTEAGNPLLEKLHGETLEALKGQLNTEFKSPERQFICELTAHSLGFWEDTSPANLNGLLSHCQRNSNGGYWNPRPKASGGHFDLEGLRHFNQSLNVATQHHSPARLVVELKPMGKKYLRLSYDLTLPDGSGWLYGDARNNQSQLAVIELILQGLKHQWIKATEIDAYLQKFQSLFQSFFAQEFDPETGTLKAPGAAKRLRAAADLLRLRAIAKELPYKLQGIKPRPLKRIARYVSFHKTNRIEHGIFIYQDPESQLHLALPLIQSPGPPDSATLASPYSPGLFEWTTERYLPLFIPQLQFGSQWIVPSHYGKHCAVRLGKNNSISFSYEQPDLVNTKGEIVPKLGSCLVSWDFEATRIKSSFSFKVNSKVQVKSINYTTATLQNPNPLFKEPEIEVLRDDFKLQWNSPEPVEKLPKYATGNNHLKALRQLQRRHTINLRPGQDYTLELSLKIPSA